MMRRCFQAALSALLLVAAFPPLSVAAAAFFALVPLFFAVRGLGPRRAFVVGLVNGTLFYAGTVYWVVVAMHRYGGMPLAASLVPALALFVYLGLYHGVFALALARGGRLIEGPPGLVVIPALWTTLEFLRGKLFTGFPWSVLGYSQVPFLPLVQIADITGVWGVSFLVVAVNVAVWRLIDRYGSGRGRLPAVELACALALLTTVAAYGFIRISAVLEAVEGWEKVETAVVQGNIEQTLKWDLDYRRATVETYRRLSLEAARRGARLVVWPESAVPFYLDGDRELGPVVKALPAETGAVIVTGAPAAERDGAGGYRYFNSAYVLDAGGVAARYDKFHLVPFGEYVPLRKVLFFVDKLAHGVGDFTPGRGPFPVRAGPLRLGVIICFEAIFPDISAALARNGAQLLVNLTNDAWYGRSSAPYQHLALSLMRAVETRTYLVRAANTGISAVIDPAGRVMDRREIFEEGLIVEPVGIREGAPSFYAARGDVFAWAAAAVTALWLVAVAAGFERRL